MHGSNQLVYSNQLIHLAGYHYLSTTATAFVFKVEQCHRYATLVGIPVAQYTNKHRQIGNIFAEMNLEQLME